MSNNGNTEGTLRKKCPFSGEWCSPAECAIAVQVTQHSPVGQKMADVCAFPALVMMISEINQKTVVPQQKINLPSLHLRG